MKSVNKVTLKYTSKMQVALLILFLYLLILYNILIIDSNCVCTIYQSHYTYLISYELYELKF